MHTNTGMKVKAAATDAVFDPSVLMNLKRFIHSHVFVEEPIPAFISNTHTFTPTGNLGCPI